MKPCGFVPLKLLICFVILKLRGFIFVLYLFVRSRVNTNILTRRLCRNRSCDDNELYRSNSFKFERFRRDDSETLTMAVNTLPKQVCNKFSKY